MHRVLQSMCILTCYCAVPPQIHLLDLLHQDTYT